MDFIVNVVLNRDLEVVAAFGGDFKEAFLKGLIEAVDLWDPRFSQLFDVVVTVNSGYPLDQNFYHTVKGNYTASIPSSEGEVFIIASECREGVGPDEFYRLNKERSRHKGVVDYIRENEPIIAQWENQVMCEVLLQHDVYLVSSLPDKEVGNIMIILAKSIDDALRGIVENCEEYANVLVIPEGPFSLPFRTFSDVAKEIKWLKGG